jgi:HK97 family phage prohead protease/HK97 family phage major capsid protein
MQIKPNKGESQSDFTARCIPEIVRTGRSREQAVAICMDLWHKEVPDPEEYDDEDEFMSDCVDEIGSEDACQMIWENAAAKDIQYKTHSATVSGMEFVLSDETPDRLDDVIMSDGWDLKAFKRNPIALFGHRSDFPIGKWLNIRVENKQLIGHLEMAAEGTSPRIDEIRRLIDSGILKAVSVGFRPLESKKREGTDWGYVYTKSELVETSVVAVPANPNALAIAKSLKISPEVIDLVFAGQGDKGRVRHRGFTGGHARRSNSNRGAGQMSGLSQRIQDLETQIIAKKDALQVHLEKMDDTNVSNSDLEIMGKFNQDIAQLERIREGLVDSEKILVKTAGNGSDPQPTLPPRRSLVSVSGNGNGNGNGTAVRPRTVRTAPDLLGLFVRAGTIALHARGWGRTVEETRNKIGERFPEYRDDDTKVMSDIVLRAASAPAMTTVTGWAAELAHTTYADQMPLLMPNAIMTRLATRGLPLSFGSAGRIVIPTRSRTPSLAGSFVGEGMAIPVRQGAFTSQTLTPKKMAVITTWTKEMDEHSIPAIEGILRDSIQVDTTVAIDSVLIDANPATVIRPAGLLNGVAAIPATSGGGIPALVGDLVGVIGAISTATYGNVRSPVWLVNQTDMLRAGLLSAANTGIFPFRDEIKAGTLATIPYIDSANVPSKTMILVDAADFVVVGGDAPRMEMSDQATLHMEDTTPLELVASPSTVAAPQRSLFQTDSLALRMVLPLNWLQRRAGTVAWVQNVTW